ncbi:YopX family protein [Bacillus safensis]|uniref:YopX family protein n=1 Tax=Bacillus safensis TaxID=561879 RepID=UPI000469F8F2|nr:YopX family protein [Bacillus safensis]
MDIVIRYVFKHRSTGNIEIKIYSISQLEERPAQNLSPCFDTTEYELIARNLFAGLEDKNGVWIYEGDTVRLRNESGFTSLGEVQFSDGCFEVKFQSGLPVFNGARHQYTKYQDYVKVFAANHAIEVVGNIYQNPVLLKERA